MDDSPVIIVPPVILNVTTRMAWRDDACVRLAPLECDMLLRLMQEPGKVVRHDQLAAAIWERGRTAAQIQALARKLRERLDHIGCHDVVQVAPLRGYWFAPARGFDALASDFRRLIETHPDAALADRVRSVVFGAD